MDENGIAQLRAVLNRLAAIPDAQMNALEALLSSAFYHKNEYFVKAGECQPHIGFVVDGLFRLFYTDRKGKEYTKNFFASNHFAAPYSALLQGKPSNLYIQALEDSKVLLIDNTEWLKFADTHPCWQIAFRKITEQAYLQKEKRESDLLLYDAETRYIRFKNEFPNWIGRIKQHHIASYLGMSPETLSRVKKQLHDKCQ